jgi:hypothetical protein
MIEPSEGQELDGRGTVQGVVHYLERLKSYLRKTYEVVASSPLWTAER